MYSAYETYEMRPPYSFRWRARSRSSSVVKNYEEPPAFLDTANKGCYNEGINRKELTMYQNKVTRQSTHIFVAVAVGVFVLLSLIWTIAVDLTTGLALGAFVTIPAAIVGWFILSLVLYLRAKKRGDDDLIALKSRLTAATVLLVFLVAMIALLIGFFAMAISHM